MDLSSFILSLVGYMKPNPYESPAAINDIEEADTPISLPLHHRTLSGLIVATATLAFCNAIDQEMGLIGSALLTFLAILSQVPGLCYAYLALPHPPFAGRIRLTAAYIVATTGCLGFLICAVVGPAESLHTVGHMLVIVFPIALCLFAILLFVGAELLLWGASSFHQRSGIQRLPKTDLEHPNQEPSNIQTNVQE